MNRLISQVAVTHTAQGERVLAHLPEAASLVVVSPMLAELVSGSVPPRGFFVPWVFALFALLYGASALLIRELTLRWGTGWAGILLMGAAFGILQEGCATRAFVDPLWHSMGPLTGHGRWLGVNWIWTIDAILYHAVYSTALPIVVIYLVFPKTQTQPWVGTGGLWLTVLFFAAALSVFMHAGSRYAVSPWYFVACLLTVFLFWAAAYRIHVPLRALSPHSAGAVGFGLLGFGATAALVLQIYVVPTVLGTTGAVIVLVALVAVSCWLVMRWTGGQEQWSRNQQFGLVAGTFSCFALLDLFQEHNPTRSDDTRGMSLIGIAVFAAITWLALRLRRRAPLLDRS